MTITTTVTGKSNEITNNNKTNLNSTCEKKNNESLFANAPKYFNFNKHSDAKIKNNKNCSFIKPSIQISLGNCYKHSCVYVKVKRHENAITRQSVPELHIDAIKLHPRYFFHSLLS